MLTSRTATPGHAQAAAPQSVEAVRRRARHRLIGAAVLVLLGVLGFPMLFDTQPRPMAVDIPIEIPARSGSQSVTVPTPPAVAKKPSATPAETTAAAPSAAASLPASESLSAREEVVEPTPALPAKPVSKPEPKPEAVAKPVDKPKDTPSQTEAARARALLEDKADKKPAAASEDAAATASERIVVQVGAFADVLLARQARLKLERAGLKTYTHVAETPQGRRIRVRLGPFATRAEADKAAARAKALGLPAAILTL